MSKTKQQLAGDELFSFAFDRIITAKPANDTLFAFMTRLVQIMERDNLLNPELKLRVNEMLGFGLRTLNPDIKGLERDADNYEKIYHQLADANYLRAVALASKSIYSKSPIEMERSTPMARACVKAFYCCGRGTEITTALMLVF